MIFLHFHIQLYIMSSNHIELKPYERKRPNQNKLDRGTALSLGFNRYDTSALSLRYAGATHISGWLVIFCF